MRALLIFAAFLVVFAAAFVSPYAGLLSWAWFSFMQPHREAFGFAYNFPFDFYLAIGTLIAWLLSPEKKQFPVGATTILFLLFAVWVALTTYLAISPAASYESWDKCEKSILLALFVAMMATTRVRIQSLIWIIGISLGYYAVKGAGYVLTGGTGHVLGPGDSDIADNNHLSVALVSILPILIYLARTSDKTITRLGSSLVAASVLVSVIGTYSRGGFLTLLALGGLLVIRSRARLALTVASVIALLLIVQYAPPAWRERMDTIWTAEGDASFQERRQAWEVTWKTGLDRPIFGGGFKATEIQEVWDHYTGLPYSTHYRAAHNLYLEVLSAHGFVGLALYLLIVASALRNTRIAAKTARSQDGPRWVLELANALQLSIFALLVGGLALSIAYYDVYLTLFALTFALRRFVEQTETDRSDIRSSSPNPIGSPAIASPRRFRRPVGSLRSDVK